MVIEPAYMLRVGGQWVTPTNVQDVLGDGTVTYNPYERTLTLTNADINKDYKSNIGLENFDINLTIKLVGKNQIQGTYASGILTLNDLTITGDVKASLNLISHESIGLALLKSYGNFFIEGGCRINIKGNTYGIIGSGTEILTINGSTVKAFGVNHGGITHLYGLTLLSSKITYPENGKYDATKTPKGVYVEDRHARLVEIEPISSGLASLTEQGVQVRGNKGVIHIIAPAGTDRDLTDVLVYNMQGALIRTASLRGTNTPVSNDIEIANMQPGIYIVRIGNAAEKVVVL